MENKKLLAVFAVVPAEVLSDTQLSAGAKIVLAAMYGCATQFGSDNIWPGHAALSRATGTPDRTLRRHLDELRKQGWLAWKRRGRGKTNRYEIVKTDLVVRKDDRPPAASHNSDDRPPTADPERPPAANNEYRLEADTDPPKEPAGKRGRKKSVPLPPELAEAWVARDSSELVKRMVGMFNANRKHKMVITGTDYAWGHKVGATVVIKQKIMPKEFVKIIKYHETKKIHGEPQYGQYCYMLMQKLDGITVKLRMIEGANRDGKKDWGNWKNANRI